MTDIFTTPREVALVQENDILKEQIRRLEWEHGARSPRANIQGRPVETRELAAPGIRTLSLAAYAGVEHEDRERAYRVVARYCRGPEALSYNYYVSDREVLGASDQTTLLAHLHQQLMRTFAEELRKRNDRT